MQPRHMAGAGQGAIVHPIPSSRATQGRGLVNEIIVRA